MSCQTEIAGFDFTIKGAHGPLFEIKPDGVLTLHPGYSWDGASGPAIDTASFMEASAAHDALYQLIKEGLLPASSRKKADQLLRRLALEDGMPKWRAAYVYFAVRLFGWLWV